MSNELALCVRPDGHVWQEDDILGACEVCGDHAGLICTNEGCSETVDLVWDEDPRD